TIKNATIIWRNRFFLIANLHSVFSLGAQICAYPTRGERAKIALLAPFVFVSLWWTGLLVTERLDRIHAGSFEGGQHAADQPYQEQYQSGNHHRRGFDLQRDIAFAGGVLEHLSH